MAVMIGGFIPPITRFLMLLVVSAAVVAVERAFVSRREVISPANDSIFARKAFAWGIVVSSLHDCVEWMAFSSRCIDWYILAA
jgi:hypothetical protein